MQINICLSSFKMLNYVDVIQRCNRFILDKNLRLLNFISNFFAVFFKLNSYDSRYNILQVHNVVGNYLTSKVEIHNNIMYAYLPFH